MIFEFNWNDCRALNNEEKRKLESKIKDDLENEKGSFFSLCHQGAVEIQLNIVGPLLTELVGNIKCSCGKALLTFKGSSDGAKITYE